MSVVGCRHRDTILRSGQVSERLKERHWKCRVWIYLYRGFESHPVRLMVGLVQLGTFRQTTRSRAVAQLGSAPYWGCGGRWFESSQPDFENDPVAWRRGRLLSGLFWIRRVQVGSPEVGFAWRSSGKRPRNSMQKSSCSLNCSGERVNQVETAVPPGASSIVCFLFCISHSIMA